MSEEQAQQMLQQMQMLENMYAEMSQKENSIKNIMRDADSAIKSIQEIKANPCLLYTSPSPRDLSTSRMPSSA